MKIEPQEAKKMEQLLERWESSNKITPDQKAVLEQDLQASTSGRSSFDWKNLSFLSFFFAVVCIILATSLMVIDNWIEKILDYVIEVSDWVKSIFLFLLASLLYYFAHIRRRQYPRRVFSNEAIFLFGAVSVAFALMYLGYHFGMYDGYFPILILLSAFLYGAVGLLLHSNINWYLALAALALWFGTETAYRSGWESYFLGMNYPMRYLLFGILLLGLYRLFRALNFAVKFRQSTYTIGLLSLFFSFWLLSIFGNYTDLEAWSEVAQYRFIYWALILALASGLAIWYGLRYQDRIARELGIIFLLLNIYTRYFEYFWDSLHKVVFFSILALSFWLLGSKAENFWSQME